MTEQPPHMTSKPKSQTVPPPQIEKSMPPIENVDQFLDEETNNHQTRQKL